MAGFQKDKDGNFIEVVWIAKGKEFKTRKAAENYARKVGVKGITRRVYDVGLAPKKKRKKWSIF